MMGVLWMVESSMAHFDTIVCTTIKGIRTVGEMLDFSGDVGVEIKMSRAKACHSVNRRSI